MNFMVCSDTLGKMAFFNCMKSVLWNKFQNIKGELFRCEFIICNVWRSLGFLGLSKSLRHRDPSPLLCQVTFLEPFASGRLWAWTFLHPCTDLCHFYLLSVLLSQNLICLVIDILVSASLSLRLTICMLRLIALQNLLTFIAVECKEMAFPHYQSKINSECWGCFPWSVK